MATIPSPSVSEFIKKSGLKVTQIIIGMVMDVGIVTQMPGYDFRLSIHILTQEENVSSRHQVVIAANGQSMAEVKMNYVGKYVFTVKDEQGRATQPIKGRCRWQEKRNVFIDPLSEFSIVCKARGEKFSETYYVFNDQEKKRMALPLPPFGWRVAILTFSAKECGYKFKFVADGEKEQPVIRPSTAQPRSALRAKTGIRRSKTAKQTRTANSSSSTARC